MKRPFKTHVFCSLLPVAPVNIPPPDGNIYIHTPHTFKSINPTAQLFHILDREPKLSGAVVAPTSEVRAFATFCYRSQDFKMYNKYTDFQWHKFISSSPPPPFSNTNTTTTTTHHELGLFWSHLTVSSKVFQVIFIHLVYFSALFLVSCCLFLLHVVERTQHYVHTEFRKNRSPSSKETQTTHSLSLSKKKCTSTLTLVF
jgi:hypothetical protein